MDNRVLDSSAILAVIFNEPGSDSVAPLLQGALASSVNLTEVYTRLLLRGVPADLAWGRILSMGFEICPYDEGQAHIAAEMIAQSRPLGLSLGDRACLALAIERKATVYTTDRMWEKLGLGIHVNVIR